MEDVKTADNFVIEEKRDFWEAAKIFEVDENGEEREIEMEELREKVG